jgi:hypothetical protein
MNNVYANIPVKKPVPRTRKDPNTSIKPRAKPVPRKRSVKEIPETKPNLVRSKPHVKTKKISPLGTAFG